MQSLNKNFKRTTGCQSITNWIISVFLIVAIFAASLAQLLTSHTLDRSLFTEVDAHLLGMQGDVYTYGDLLLVEEERSSDTQSIDRALLDAIRSAKASTKIYATDRFDDWSDGLELGLNNEFLDWYESWAEVGQQKYMILSKYVLKEDLAKVIGQDFSQTFLTRMVDGRRIEQKYGTVAKQSIRRFLAELTTKIVDMRVTYGFSEDALKTYIGNVQISSDGENPSYILSSLPLIRSSGSSELFLKPVSVDGQALSLELIEGITAKLGLSLAPDETKRAVESMPNNLIDPSVIVGLPILEIWLSEVDLEQQKYAIQTSTYQSLDRLVTELLDSTMAVLDELETGVKSNTPWASRLAKNYSFLQYTS